MPFAELLPFTSVPDVLTGRGGFPLTRSVTLFRFVVEAWLELRAVAEWRLMRKLVYELCPVMPERPLLLEFLLTCETGVMSSLKSSFLVNDPFRLVCKRSMC